MIDNFDDFCLWMYVMIDDFWQDIAPEFKRSGPAPTSCSDSELLAMALIGECRGWDVETELLSCWREHRDLFPRQPSQSRFNRRRRALTQAFNHIRRAVLNVLDWAQCRDCVLDSLPIAVVAFHHAPRASAEWRIHDASFGKVSSKQQTFFGYKLHLLLTIDGVIVDWLLAPAHVRDLPAGVELLDPYSHLCVLGDKAYVSAPVAAALRHSRAIALLTLPRRTQRWQIPRVFHKPFQDARRIIETVNGQLTEQFHVERNHTHSFSGLCARLATKLTAHTLSVYLNRLLGNCHPLHIKALAFPN
jgi:hypothetical protein